MTIASLQTITTLARISQKPDTSKRDQLTIARHVLRRACAYCEAIHTERRVLHLKAHKLRQFEPFTKLAADALEQQANDHGAERPTLIRPVLLTYGQLLIRDQDGFMAALGFDAVCDLLNINRIEREQARAEGVVDLAGLIFVRNLEDSASRRGEDCRGGRGGPLFAACYAAFCELIKMVPEGALPDLTVHDANGSRVLNW